MNSNDNGQNFDPESNAPEEEFFIIPELPEELSPSYEANQSVKETTDSPEKTNDSANPAELYFEERQSNTSENKKKSRALTFTAAFLILFFIGMILLLLASKLNPGFLNLTTPSTQSSTSAPVTSTAPPATTEPPTTAAPVYTPFEEELAGEIALFIDLNNEKTLFEKNSEQITAPASLTKIVTACVLLQKYGDNLKDVQVKVPKEAIAQFEGTVASVVPLSAGETVSMYELLYSIMLPSACDAANVAAYYYGDGDPQPFVDEMNNFVEKLGCKDTHFMNPHGLDAEGHQTTARDMYKIAKAAMEIPQFMEIVGNTTFIVKGDGSVPERKINSTIALMNKESPCYFPYATGIKTGSTSKAGRCIITIAQKDGYNFMCIVMKAPYSRQESENDYTLAAQYDAQKLLNWAFDCANISD